MTAMPTSRYTTRLAMLSDAIFLRAMLAEAAAPPIRAPKSRPHRVTIGIIELRSTWRLITVRRGRPLSTAVRV